MQKMRELESRDLRYRWRDPNGGELGEMPHIVIEKGEEIPPLEKAHYIYIDFSRSVPAESDIGVTWVTSSGVSLKLYCQVDDPRLKKQYKNSVQFSEKVLELLSMDEQPGKPSSHYRNFQWENHVNKEEIPVPLQPFVFKVERWKAFFQKPDMAYVKGSYYVNISIEGYYLAYVGGSCFRLGVNPSDLINNEGCFDPGPIGFNFDPKTEPPTVVGNGVYWGLAEPKILIILVHESSNERIATYYGYLEQFQKFMIDKKKSEEESRAHYDRMHEKEAEEKRKQEENLRKVLFS